MHFMGNFRRPSMILNLNIKSPQTRGRVKEKNEGAGGLLHTGHVEAFHKLHSGKFEQFTQGVAGLKAAHDETVQGLRAANYCFGYPKHPMDFNGSTDDIHLSTQAGR